jgi:hypothetical protein
MPDMYTDVERSIYKVLDDALKACGYDYLIFNNLVTRKDYEAQHGCICLIKSSDVPNFKNGGGTTAKLREPAGFNPNDPKPFTQFNVQDWPQCYDLLYQLHVVGDDLSHLRRLEALIRTVLRPQGILKIWDSIHEVWTNSYSDISYAGYINRDVPEDSQYWRVTNIRFEVYNYDATVSTEPAITEVPELDFDIQT